MERERERESAYYVQGILLRSCIYQQAKQQSLPSWSLHLAWNNHNEQKEKHSNLLCVGLPWWRSG